MSRRSRAVTLRSDLRRPQMYLLLVAAIAALPRLMFRFSGEDPIKGHPFYHEKITREAARKAGWDGAGEPDTPPDGEDDRSVANGLAGRPTTSTPTSTTRCGTPAAASPGSSP